MKRKLQALILILILTASLPGCANSGAKSRGVGDGSFEVNQSLNPNYACTIDVCSSWGNFEALDEAAYQFKAYYPNIEVVHNTLSDYMQDLRNRMTTGKGVDIFMCDSYIPYNEEDSWLWENAQDLSEIGLDLEQITTQRLETGYVEDKLALVPVYDFMAGLAVNVTLLKENGLEVPRSQEEFIHCLEVLKANGYTPLLVKSPRFLVNAYFGDAYRTILGRQDANSCWEMILEGKDPDGILQKKLDQVSALYEKGYVHPESEQLADEYGAVIMRFLEGDIPFFATHSSYYSGTKKREAKSEAFCEKPFEYAFIPFPGEEGPVCVYRQTNSQYFGVYDGIEDEKKAYVDEFLRYLLTQGSAQTMEQIKNMPVANDAISHENFPYLYGDGASDVYKIYVGSDQNAGSFEKAEGMLWEAGTKFNPGMNATEYLNK